MKNEAHLKAKGVVSIEVLLLFPFIVGILYASAYYSILFSWQYRMQNVVDRSVSEALYFDRSRVVVAEGETESDRIREEVLNRAGDLLQSAGPVSLPTGVAAALDFEEACFVQNSNLVCDLSLSQEKIEELLPSVGFGFLGKFPPAPSAGISAKSVVAF